MSYSYRFEADSCLLVIESTMSLRVWASSMLLEIADAVDSVALEAIAARSWRVTSSADSLMYQTKPYYAGTKVGACNKQASRDVSKSCEGLNF